MRDNRALVRAWRYLALAAFPVCLALTALACSADLPNTGLGSSGAAGSAASPGGASSSAGSPATTAGMSSGGAPSGGAAAGGASGSPGVVVAGSPSGGSGVGGRGGGGGATAVGGSNSVGGAGTAGAATGGSSGTGRSTGCGKTSSVTFGQVPGETDQNKGTGAGGYVKIGNRGFAMRLPDNYDSSHSYPVFFGFHWNGGSAKEVDTGGTNGYLMAHFGLQKLSKNGAIFVAPDGLNAGWANSGGQDLKLVDDMLALIEDNYCVDTTHIFTNGFSYGGGMSYEIACARAKVFRGAAIYEGAQLSGCDGGNDPIALWQMVGLEDNTCPMSLATPIRDRFVKNNGCTAQSPPQPAKAPPYSSTGGHICTDYAGCSSGHPLRWCVHQSGHGNAIVDGTGDLYNSCASPPKTCSSTCPCSWVPDDVWAFFQKL